MKRILITLALFFSVIAACFAQAPQKFSYQAVVRNESNTLVRGTVGVRVSILQGGVNGTVVYQESHITTTNANGLMTLEIGGGSLLSGDFATIDWANGPYFLKTETDPYGGTNYTIEGTQQLLSVPYALYAGSAANSFSGSYNDLTDLPQMPDIPTNASAFNNDAGYITMDSVPEIPTNVSAFVNDAGYVTESTLTTENYITQNDLITNNYVTEADIPTNVSAFTNDAGYITANDVPAYQVLSISNDTISLSNGGYAVLPAGFDGDYNSLTNRPNLFSGDYNDLTNQPQIPQVPTNVSTFTNDAGYITLSQVPAQVNADWNATAGVTQILNKPTIPAVPVNVSAFTNDAHYITEFQLQEILNTITTMQNSIDSMNQVIEDMNNQVNPPVPTLGTVITLPVESITSSTAVAGGNVTSNGHPEITARGVCWSTTTPPTIADSHTTDSTGLGTFTSIVSGLASSTTYYLCAYATNEVGTAYGEIVSFTTTSAPSFTCGTSTLTDIDGNTYNTVLIGNQCWMKENLRTTKYANNNPIAQGSETSTTTAYWYYPNDDASNVSIYGLLYNWPAVMNGSASSNAIPSGVQGICPNGWHVPSDREFQEMEFTAGMSANDTSLRQYRGNIAARLSGNLGWQTSTVPNTPGNFSTENHNSTGFSALPAGSYYGSGTYSEFVQTSIFWTTSGYVGDSLIWRYKIGYNKIGLDRDTRGKNNSNSVRCVCNMPMPMGELPLITTNVVTDITSNSAICGGNVVYEGNSAVTIRGVCWSTSENPTIDNSHTEDGSGQGSFVSTLTGLASGTTYYVRAYATTELGTTYGEMVSFTPIVYTIPVVTTGTISNIATTSASSGGNVTSDGGATVTARGICWSTSHNPTTSNSKTTNGTGTGSFTSSLTGLTSNTTYYVRAYATNSVGTAYGEERSFSTATMTLPTPTISVERNDNNFYFTIQTPGVSGVTYYIKTYAGNSYTCSNTSDPTTSGSGSTGTGANSTATFSFNLLYPVLIFKVIGKKSGYNNSSVRCYTGYWE